MNAQRNLTALVIFLGSFLLFGVQPMMGRTLLSSFGGTAAVWAVCLSAYQVLLLVGYVYAHGVTRLEPLIQRRLHIGLLILATVWALCFSLLQRPVRAALGNSAAPGLEVLLAVTFIVGLPYVLLASGSALLQAWLTQTGEGRGVYRLYGVSNLGSFLGLLAYPLLFEPFVAVTQQWYGFGILLALYAILLVWCARGSMKSVSDEAPAANSELIVPVAEPAPPPRSRPDRELPHSLSAPWLWYALPALSSFLLVATTNHVTLDIAPIPMIWVAVLGLFVLSYVVGFSHAGERALPLWMLLGAAAVACMAAVTQAHVDLPGHIVFRRTLFFGLPAFFLVLVFIHAWLYTARPDGSRLTRFYLGVAVGGAVGGVAAGIGAPLLLRTVAEYPAALVLCALAVGAFVWIYWHPELRRGLNQAALLACIAVPALVTWRGDHQTLTVLHRDRGFYGTVSVISETQQRGRDSVVVHSLLHGRTRHGLQPQTAELSGLPTAYYSPGGGGLALASHPKTLRGEPLRVSFIGLGIGVMATYGRQGDMYRFYEISPEVLNVATNPAFFTYIADSLASVELVEGDARKALEREHSDAEPGYDVLMLDAYSGDSIPLHLTTDEAFDLYRARLAPGGILALHISNWQFDFFPLCKMQAERMGMHAVGTIGSDRPADWIDESSWVFMSEEKFEPVFDKTLARLVDWDRVPRRAAHTITDDHGSLLPYLMRLAPR